MTFKTINSVQYYFEQFGEGEPVVLLHGFTGSGANWRCQRDVLSQQYTVVTVDLLGHGKTESPRDVAHYQMDKVADDVVTIFKDLFDKPVRLLGYSMGGRLALYITVYYQSVVRKLILESASPGLQSDDERLSRVRSDEKLANFIEQEGIEQFVEYWTQIPLFESQRRLSCDTQEQLNQQRLQNSPLGLANSLRGMGTGVQPPLWDDLQHLQIPVQLVIGELDHKFVAIADEMKSHLPTSEIVIIPEAGHTTHLEQPSNFLKAVADFLEE